MVKACVSEDLVASAQVQYLECVDVMIKQLVRRLHQAEAGGQGHYCVCVTGDHSTPVLFGDHSHEPVPFTVAHVRHVVSPLLTLTCVCQLVVNNISECMKCVFPTNIISLYRTCVPKC